MKKVVLSSSMKVSVLILGLLMMSVYCLHAQTIYTESTKQELINLSKQKWQWMAEQNVDSLDVLFHKEAVFVHMGGTMNKEQEINIIKSGGIRYKHAEIEETSVRFVGNTAIILDKIRLTAVVGGSEVVNPFMVTEVYIIDRWKMDVRFAFIYPINE